METNVEIKYVSIKAALNKGCTTNQICPKEDIYDSYTCTDNRKNLAK